MHALLLLGLVGAVLGDSCTDYNHPKFGKVGKCISKNCCAFGTYISSLCSGDNACCFAQDKCGSGSVLGGCPNIVSRSAWGARSPSSVTYLSKQPVHYAFIHHGESAPCTSQSSCSAIVRSYQNYHMDTHGWSDIGYSFLIGEDGNAYEGRGWDRVGAHTQGYNSVGLGGLDCSDGHRYNARGTAYYPDNSALEGGFVDMRGSRLHTLQDFLEGSASYVSVAMDNRAGIAYGTTICIPQINHKYNRKIIFKVVDTGSAFFGKGHSRIDICVRSASYSYDSTINNSLTLVFP